MKKEKIYKYLLYLSLYLNVFIIVLVYMIRVKFDVNTFDQILFHLTQPMGDAAPHLIKSVAKHTVLKSVLFFLGVLSIAAVVHKITVKPGRKFSAKYIFTVNDSVFRKIMGAFLAAGIVFMVFYGAFGLKIVPYLINSTKPYSLYYENNYIYPLDDNIGFPRKNNLIIIYLESIEKAHYKKEVFDNVITPNIARMSRENLSFTGYKQVFGTGWTIGSIFSSYCGVPLDVVIGDSNMYGRFKSFFSNIKCLPEILKDNGYRTCYMQGAGLGFAGKKKFFSQHGIDEMYGKDEFFERGDFREEYRGDWGVNDRALFAYAKEKLKVFSKGEGPFFFSVLTVDTHTPDGFVDPECENKFDKQLKNSVACVDCLLGEFMEWMEKQDFYKDTTIVILGDHLSMPCMLTEELKQDSDREVVNIFINPLKTTERTNRSFCMFDLMPTIIESMGGEIKGGRLGLGTSLFCGKKTLIERDKRCEFDKKIYEKSRLYESFR